MFSLSQPALCHTCVTAGENRLTVVFGGTGGDGQPRARGVAPHQRANHPGIGVAKASSLLIGSLLAASSHSCVTRSSTG
jgi:hypothetical protein